MPNTSSPAAVLVVDDESLVRMFAVDVLEEEGYQVFEAASAADALATLNAYPEIRLVFTDINMPGAMDGIDLAREIANTKPGVQVVLTSGKQVPKEQLLKTVFVTKPYTAAQLVGLLQKMVDGRS
jgi:two-component system, response regulator PdtaR